MKGLSVVYLKGQLQWSAKFCTDESISFWTPAPVFDQFYDLNLYKSGLSILNAHDKRMCEGVYLFECISE